MTPSIALGPKSLRGLIERRVRQNPDAIAMRWGDASISFGELVERTAELVVELRHLDETRPVAVRVDRHPWSLFAIVAAMLADRAYVPIGSEQPDAHLNHVIRQSNASILLEPDGEAGVATTRLAPASSTDAMPASTAYVLFTSGTSGTPKGCVIPQSNVLSMLQATGPLVEGSTCSSLLHSLAFDFSVWEVWSAWAHGGHVVMMTEREVLNPRRFMNVLTAQGVTLVSMTPSYLSTLTRLHANSSAEAPDVRLVVLGGESVVLDDVERCVSLGLFPNARIVNMYGITETTVHSTLRALDGESRSDQQGWTPIGLPLEGVEIEVRDAHGKKVPAGSDGEIWVAGWGVAAGYIGDEELTARSFVSDPGDARRWYRSGDRGRYAGGELHHGGRLDRQVQLHGHRVELGAVEAAIDLFPDVRRSHATIETASTGTPQLVAYVETDASEGSRSVSRRLLAEHLPKYALPSRIFEVDAFRLTSNGKISVHGVTILGEIQ